MSEQQQSSAARVGAANFRTFWYKGVEYLLSQPSTMGSYKDEESIVLWKRNNPVDFVIRFIRSGLDVAYHQGAMNASALASNGGIPSEDEWKNYGQSMWKQAYLLWTCLDPKHKRDAKGNPVHLKDGIEHALKILYDAVQYDAMLGVPQDSPQSKLNELRVKCQIVSQEDVIKNWSGPPSQEDWGAAAETAIPDQPTEAGPAS